MSEQAGVAPSNGEGKRTINRTINQGDIYWVTFAGPDDPAAGADTVPPDTVADAIPYVVQESAIPHPCVIVQDDLFNHSRIHTVVVCALTSNLRRAGETPGNVLLDAGEANLPKQSVVEVSKISSVEKARLGDYVGTLSAARVYQILAGMRFLQKTFFAR